MSFRTELKIPIVPGQAQYFLKSISDRGATRLHPNRTVRSTYFDNFKLKLYHDSEEGLLPRKKFRIRTYPDVPNAEYFLENKISSYEGRFKTTKQIDYNHAEKLMKVGIFDGALGSVKPTLIVQYAREYFTLDDIRITLDTSIQYENPVLKKKVNTLDPMNVIELKSAYGIPQDQLEDIFSSQKARFSKYCRGIKLFGLC